MDMFKLVLQCDVRKEEMLHYIFAIASLFSSQIWATLFM